MSNNGDQDDKKQNKDSFRPMSPKKAEFKAPQVGVKYTI
jgi:hypothetical protein